MIVEQLVALWNTSAAFRIAAALFVAGLLMFTQ